MEKEFVDNYKPLDCKKNEIRLLRLKPCQYNRDIKQDKHRIICFLEKGSLDHTIEYTALSYAWENGLERQEISVSGHEHLVSANLVDALRQIRQEFDELVLWTDQLCINQNDHAEKASQIQKMSNIYEGATRVIAWLGVSANDSDLVFTTLNYIDKYHQLPSRTSLLSEIARDMQTNSNGPDQIWGSSKVLNTLRAALPAFASRRYWTRLWVLQEFAVATNLLIMCGSKSVPYSTLRNVWGILRQADDDPDGFARHKSPSVFGIIAISEVWQRDSTWWDAWLGIKRFISARDDYHSRHQHQHPGQITHYGMLTVMYTTLTTFSGQIRMSCSDPRDRVFSLLGLASDSQTFAHFPDYTRCVERIYEELAQNFLQQGHVDVLSFCQENPVQRARNMASWAADWSVNIRIPLWGKVPVNASQDWSSDLALSVLDCGKIMISGTCIGTIQSHGCHLCPDKPLTLLQMQLFLNQIKVFCDRSNLIQADEEELACSLLAAPTATAYVESKNLMLAEYQEVLEILGHIKSLPGDSEAELDLQYSSQYEKEIRCQLFRCPFITANGHVGIAPPYVQERDCICIFPGGCVPYILRQQLNSNNFRVIGAAYVHGIMNGEYFKTEREVRTFTLE